MNNRTRQKLKLNHGIKLKGVKLWNCNYTIAKLIASSVYQFRHYDKHSMPGNLPPFDIQYNMEKWNNILDEIVYCFNEIANDHPDSQGLSASEKSDYISRIDNGKELFIKYLDDMWD